MIPIVGISIWPVLKFFVIIGLGMYIVFALVMLRQVQLMTDTVEVGFETPVRLLAMAHLLFATGVLVLALIIL